MIANSEHLGDGAYVSTTSYGIVLTAGHHDPNQAEAAVFLEPACIAALERWLARMKEEKKL